MPNARFEASPVVATGSSLAKAGGERAAAIYTIIKTCKLNGVEPFAYISSVMQKIAEGWPNSRIDELMPWAWSPVAQQKAA